MFTKWTHSHDQHPDQETERYESPRISTSRLFFSQLIPNSVTTTLTSDTTVQRCLVFSIHISDITQYVLFCAWLFLLNITFVRFGHVAVWNCRFPVSLLCSPPLRGYNTVNLAILRLLTDSFQFGPLESMLLGTFSCIFLLVNTSYFSWVCTERGTAGRYWLFSFST